MLKVKFSQVSVPLAHKNVNNFDFLVLSVLVKSTWNFAVDPFSFSQNCSNVNQNWAPLTPANMDSTQIHRHK